MLQPRVVIVTRPTEYEALLVRHGTREQARFFLATRDQRIEDVVTRHRAQVESVAQVIQAIPVAWRQTRVGRDDLDRFLFEPEDLVVAIGQDGLVANTAKYLTGQAVIGLNPEPERNPGILVPHPPEAAGDLLHTAAAGRGAFEERAMVEAVTDDGQRLLALNELYLGHQTHQSARYLIALGGESEYQSSSGLIVATGTGATGWASSIHRHRVCHTVLPEPEERRLVVFVREAWPSKGTGTTLTDGELGAGESLGVTSRMNENGVIFGDGIESDAIAFDWGRRVEVRLSDVRLRLLRG